MSRVAVLMGGYSSEREVSLASGQECADGLRRVGYEVIEIDVDRSLILRLHEEKPDICFNALHGLFGEGGSVQGILNILGIPYTHSGVLASALAMNKPMAKIVARSVGLRCANGKVVTKEEYSRNVKNTPYVIKPIDDGSSINTYVVRDNGDLPFSGGGWPFSGCALIEDFIPGIELTVTVLDGVPLAVTEIRAPLGIYDYNAKYKGGSHYITPATIPDSVADQCRSYAKTMHDAIGARGISRSDFIYNPELGECGLYFLEINTHPGMTKLSHAPGQAKYTGMTFEDLVKKLVEISCTD